MTGLRLVRGGPPPAEMARDPERFELKYWVSEATARDVAAWIAPHMLPDKHGGPDAALAQCNTSLYLDTPDYVCFRRHVESYPDRFKLRVRAYGEPPAGIAFFETKRKVKSVIVKTRAALPLELVTPILEGDYDHLPKLDPTSRRHLEGFLYLQTVLGAQPAVLIRCFREAYASFDPIQDVRITLDRALRFQPAQEPSLFGDPGRWIPIDGRDQHGESGPHVMLELKFPRRAPWWMRQLVNRLKAERVGFSKYVAAVRTCEEAEDREREHRLAVSARRL